MPSFVPLSSTRPSPTARIDAFLRLFFGGIGQKNAARRLVVLLDVLDNHVVVQWLEIHGETLQQLVDEAISTLSARALAVPS